MKKNVLKNNMKIIKFSKFYKNISLIKIDFINNNEKYLSYVKNKYCL